MLTNIGLRRTYCTITLHAVMAPIPVIENEILICGIIDTSTECGNSNVTVANVAEGHVVFRLIEEGVIRMARNWGL